MADQSEETTEEEEMARQSQEPEQRSMAVVESIQPSLETRDLVRAENTQMLQAENQLGQGACLMANQSLAVPRIEGSGNLAVGNPTNCTFNILQLKPGATENILPALEKLTATLQQKRALDSAVKPTGSGQECTPPDIQKLDNFPQAAASGTSIQPKTSDDVQESVQGAHSTKDPAQVAAKSCRKAIRTHYRKTGSYVKLIPWEDDDTKHIKDIFTELTLEKSGKKLESYKDIFLQKTRDGDCINQAVLSGLAGRGKSTLIDKMAYDWACGEALQQFELVFVIRMSAVEQSTELIDSIFDQLLSGVTSVDKNSLSSFISHNQEKVLFLFDGFDELKTRALDKALFGSILKILNRKKDRECFVVVTTRPSHYDKLVTRSSIQEPFTQVKVEGFDEEDIKKYVKRFYSDEHDKAEGLIRRIKSSNALSDLAKSPMLLLLMCILWREDSKLPETMSRIYSEALEYIFHRKTDLSSDEVSKVTNELGKIALLGLLAPEQQLAFPEQVFEPNVLESAIKAGILTRHKVLKGMKSHNSIQFLHKTFQECCAGKYLQSLLETDPVDFQKNLDKMINSRINDFDYVLRFCAGDNLTCTNSILQTLAKEQGDVQIGLDCYFEGQSKDLLPVKFLKYVLTDQIGINCWNRDTLNSFTYLLRNVDTCTVENKQTDYLEKVQSVRIYGCNLSGCMSDLVDSMSLMTNLSSVVLSRCTLNERTEEYSALPGAASSAASWAHHFMKMKNLQKLVLSGCSLTGEDMTHIVSALCDLPNLVELDLSRNKSLGGSTALWAHHFMKMKNLQKLVLSGCSLTGEDMTHIASALCDLPNLVELDLSRNKSLGGSTALWAHHFMKMKNLQKLVLSGCSLTGEDMTHIVSALCDLPNLVELDFSENGYLSGSAASWAHHFKKMKNLKKLVLRDCSLTGEDMTHIASALCDLPNLVELDLSGNKSLGGSTALWAHHFMKMKNLQKLVLSGCSLTGEDMTHIASALCDLPNLVELDLSGNKSLGGSTALWAHHFMKMKNLQKLVLSGCSLTGEDMTHIVSALCDLPNLVELDFSENGYLSGSAASWAHHFKKMKNLKKLVLRDCSLTGEDMTHIASALCDLPNLVELDLSGNKSLGGSTALWAHHFMKMKNLQKLVLSGCSLTGEDMTHIAPALCDLPNLVELNLWANKSLGGSAALWAHHLKKMKNLKRLVLAYCSLIGEDMTHIAPALCDLPNLVELNLMMNESLGGSAASWAHHFKKMKNLQKFDF
ncbi:NLR family CARD domain-containing protein 4-like [Asterias amurensis]|uniref:NLR family CARD domain-containing protein 4-like n=1 Tax=Asterias amurensis TaxID=7602 RepID=UPI003AB60B69